MNRLVISPLAERDLESIGEYISLDNPSAAARLLKRLAEVSRLLSQMPRIGSRREDIGPGARVFPVGNYLILYRQTGDRIEIVRYVHGARKLSGLL